MNDSPRVRNPLERLIAAPLRFALWVGRKARQIITGVLIIWVSVSAGWWLGFRPDYLDHAPVVWLAGVDHDIWMWVRGWFLTSAWPAFVDFVRETARAITVGGNA
jgi:hypothetical protein